MTLERRNRGSRVWMGMVPFKRHFNVVLEVELRIRIAGLGLEVNDQIIFDGKDGVDVEMGIVTGVDLIDDGGVVGVRDHEMDVGRTHRGAIHKIKEHTGRPVGGQRVGSRVVAVPEELSFLIRLELAAEIVLALLRVLEVVLSIGRRLPNIEGGALDWLSGLHVFEDTVHVGDPAIGVRVLDNAVAEVPEWSIGRVEGAEDDV